MLPKNEFEGAMRVLKGHYQELMREMARDILTNEKEFYASGERDIWREAGATEFAKAEEIIREHGGRLYRLCTVFDHLSRWAKTEKPRGEEPLGKDDFRCFRCGHVIHREEDICRFCGWDWRLECI